MLESASASFKKVERGDVWDIVFEYRYERRPPFLEPKPVRRGFSGGSSTAWFHVTVRAGERMRFRLQTQTTTAYHGQNVPAPSIRKLIFITNFW